MTSTPLATGSISLRLYPHDLSAVDQVTEMKAQAVLGVEAGYEGVMVSEHHADFPRYVPNPLQISGFLLDAMPTGWAAPCPLLLPMRPYALIAEDLAWMAAAYPGRVGAGFAAGALPVDFELAEVPFEEIVDRFKESLPKVVAALRGDDPSPLARDKAIAACADQPVPMCVAAQSPGAVRRAARLGLGVLYDSLQICEVSKRLSDIYDEAGGTGPKILIRRVWIGDPPLEDMATQMDHYRSYSAGAATANWGSGDELVHGRTAEEAAERLATVISDSGCDTVNVRIHLKTLDPDQVRGQLSRHAEGFVPTLRAAMAS